ncbi:MAG TPA: hypothetical protein ACFYDZ_10390 [Candidatus Brocadiaceae bacterium]
MKAGLNKTIPGSPYLIIDFVFKIINMWSYPEVVPEAPMEQRMHTLSGEMIGLCMCLRFLKSLASGKIFFPDVHRVKNPKNFDVMSKQEDHLALTVL